MDLDEDDDDVILMSITNPPDNDDDSSSSSSEDDKEDDGRSQTIYGTAEWRNEPFDASYLTRAILRGQENRASTNWKRVVIPRAPKSSLDPLVQQEVRDAKEAALRAQAFLALDMEDCPPTDTSAQLFLSLPGAHLLLILRWCTIHDLFNLRITCREFYLRLEGIQQTEYKLGDFRGLLERVEDILGQATVTGDVSLVSGEAMQYIAMMRRMSSPSVMGSWNWAEYLKQAVRLPIWPSNAGKASILIAYLPLPKRAATRLVKCDSLETIRSLISSNTVCGNCMRPVPYDMALPINWHRLKCMPSSVCFTCMAERRTLVPVIKYFAPWRAKLHRISFELYSTASIAPPAYIENLDEDAQNNVTCTRSACVGHIKLYPLWDGSNAYVQSGAVGIGTCTSERHRGVFSFYSALGDVYACPEEMRNFEHGYDVAAPLGGEDGLRLWESNMCNKRPDIYDLLVARQFRKRRVLRKKKKVALKKKRRVEIVELD